MKPNSNQIPDGLNVAAVAKRGERILIAVSGGLDSMVLLHALHALAKTHQWKLEVAHFNHQLRGAASDGDEALVKETASRLELPFHRGSGDVKAAMRETGESLEMSARRLRHAFLKRIASQQKIRCIALAHHADDQIELFFLRLLRGAGGEGLAGMKPVAPAPFDRRIRLVRPLLQCRKAELEEYAKSQQIEFRHDASNDDCDLLRNRVRHKLLPAITRDFGAAAATGVLRSMEITGAESAFVAEAAAQWIANPSAPFDQLHTAVQRQCLHSQLVGLEVAVDFDLVEKLRQQPEVPVSVGTGVSVACDQRGIIYLKSVSEKFTEESLGVSLEDKSASINFGGLVLKWSRGAAPRNRPKQGAVGHELFDADRVGTNIILRHWRKGDRFQPIGAAQSSKLQNLLVNAKIPQEQRHRLVVAENIAGEIFWVEGLRIGEAAKLSPATKRVLRWKWQRPSPKGRSRNP